MMPLINNEYVDVKKVLSQSTCLHDEKYIRASIDDLANRLNVYYGQTPITVLVVLNGGLIFSGALLTRLTMPIVIDYVHVSRYGHGIKGESLQWRSTPQSSLRDRNVLILDDIFDEGITLNEVVASCAAQGVSQVKTAVLALKALTRSEQIQHISMPDFHALTVPDVFVFGFGMDYQGYLRNVPAIYALNSSGQKNG